MTDLLTPATSTDASLVLIGRIILLQVQVASLKAGERPHTFYDPAGIRSVEAIAVDEDGVTGIGPDGLFSDIHNRNTPGSKNRGDNGVSFGFTSHYAAMVERFGPHLEQGIAGENILVETDELLQPEALSSGLVVLTNQGQVTFGHVIWAPPCVEFSRFSAQYPLDKPSDGGIKETLQFLSDGMRGFYGSQISAAFAPIRIAVGDEVYCRNSG